MTVQAAAGAGRDDKGVSKTLPAMALMLLLALQVALPVEAAAEAIPGEVTLSGIGARVVARPIEHHVEVSFDRVGTMAFDNARVTVKKDRISVIARSADRTLYAWANRYGGIGGIGVVVRSRDRRVRAQTYSAIVNHITVNGADGVIRR